MVDFSQSNGLDNLLPSGKKQPLVDPIVNSQKPLTNGLDDCLQANPGIKGSLSSTAQGWNLNHYSTAANAIEQANSGIVFIDAAVQDYQTLIAGLKPGTEVAMLDPTRNEVEQIGKYLAGRSGISSLHIVSHGESGSLQLGGTKLGLDTLNDYANEIQHWRGALKPGGDILLYGCDVAEGEKGKTFVQKLSQLTGADVAASTNLTGNARKGGDWNLEFETGKIESPEISVAAYKDVLQTFTVNNTADSGAGSLRDAITQANNSSGPDTINFKTTDYINDYYNFIHYYFFPYAIPVPGPFASPQTINLTSGQLRITDDLIIQGTGANNLTISGENHFGVFNISSSTNTPINVTFDGLTITKGNAVFGGGIYNDSSNLTITNATVSGNSASNSGGGIFSDGGRQTITNSTVSGNTADYFGGGIYSQTGTQTITNSTVSGNTAGYDGDGGGHGGGGGIWSSGGTQTITNTTVSGNTADYVGGGIYSSGGTQTITNTTVSGNTAGYFGGGIWSTDNTQTITNSTVSDNDAVNSGGGIWSTDGTQTITNSTVSGNSAGYGGGIFNDNFSTFNVRNTIIAGNTGSSSPDVGGTFDDQGNNLIGNSDGNTDFSDSRLVGTSADPIDPKLGPLQNNGGPTQTHALFDGSPAINAGNNTDALTYDQRGTGFDRIKGGTIDIGAFESDLLPALQPPVITLPGGSLSYTENGDATVIDSGATVSDNDSADFDTGTLTVKFTTGGADEDELGINQSNSDNIGVNGTNITYNQTAIGSITSGTNKQEIVISFNSAATPTNVQALLRNITYKNTSDNPSATRTVSFVLTDGDGGTSTEVTKTINVAPKNDPPTITLSSDPLSYRENADAIIINSSASVSDVDTTNFKDSTLTVSISGSTADDVLGFATSGTTGISVDGSNISYNNTPLATVTSATLSTPLEITFNSDNATPQAVAALLQNITYKNTSDNPPASRTLSFELTEADGTTKTALTKTINITPENDAPSITLLGESLSYSENADPTVINSGATVSDDDSANFNTGTLTVSTSNGSADDELGIASSGTAGISVDGSDISYQTAGIIATFTGGTGSTPLEITFNSDNATPQAVAALLQNITYKNTSDNPPASRTLSFELTEADGTTKTALTKTINITPENDAPSITLLGESLSYSENADAKVIAPTATVSDPDFGMPVTDNNFSNFDTGTVTVKFTAGGAAEDELGINQSTADQISVDNTDKSIAIADTKIATFTGGTNGSTPLVITFNDKATPAAAEALLRNITYNNTSDNPSATRTLSFELADGDGGTSGEITKTINITPENDAPSITLLGESLNYTKNAPATKIDSGATVSDPDFDNSGTDNDFSNFLNGTLTVKFTAGGAAEDELGINQSTADQISVDNTDKSIVIGDTKIATFTGGTNGSTPLVITFNDKATPAAAEALLRNITYKNTSDNPSASSRTVSFELTDGDGGTSNAATKTINITPVNITPVNDAPIVTLPGQSINYTENAAPIAIDSGATVTDVDSANFNTGKLTVKFIQNGAVEDVLGIGNQGTGAGQIGVSGSDISYLGTKIGNFTPGTGSTPLVITFNQNASPAAAEALLRNITYNNTSDNPSILTRTVSFVLTDGDGGTSQALTKTINVTPVNDRPELVNQIANQTASENADFNFQVPTNTFTDVDGDKLTYNATLVNGKGLPSWLKFDRANGTFSGKPTNEDVGTFNIELSATDTDGKTATGSFELNVANVNNAPVANIDRFTTARAKPITISSANLLSNDTDVDGDSLSISSFSQPKNGKLVDNKDNTFTYTPDIYFQGADSFTYTVNDGHGGTATNSTNLTVNPVGSTFSKAELDQVLNTRQNEASNFNSLSFDEGFYLKQNPDVAQAVKDGVVSSGFDHFKRYGEAEGRDPGIIIDYLIFDEGFYLKQNPDVAQAVKDGVVRSGFDHFDRYGHAEGRKPSILFDEGFYLKQNPDVAQAVKAGIVSSGYDHFKRYGEAQGRNPSNLFDNSRYYADNPDVAQAVRNGAFDSGFNHYLRYGQFEGRQPNLQMFNEGYYLANNLDVAQAVKAGVVRSGFDHFVRYGEAEARNPSSLFDNSRYLAENPDVAEAVTKGVVRSGYDHYLRYGRAEGRSGVG